MNTEHASSSEPRRAGRQQQEALLRGREEKLRRLAFEEKKEEFFQQITPLLGPLKAYIKRRLRVAYLSLEIRTPVYTSRDLLDRVTFRAYENFKRKPQDLTLEHWLYRLADEVLDEYISQRKSTDARRRSLETLEKTELSTLEEIPFTADADGEMWFPEELDDSEYQPRDFTPPADQSNPEEQLEKEEELRQILRALRRVPEQERIVFDLFAIQGFSKAEVSKIADVPPDEVPRTATKVREQVRRAIEAPGMGEETKKKAS